MAAAIHKIRFTIRPGVRRDGRKTAKETETKKTDAVEPGQGELAL